MCSQTIQSHSREHFSECVMNTAVPGERSKHGEISTMLSVVGRAAQLAPSGGGMVCEAMGVGVEMLFGVEMLLDRGLIRCSSLEVVLPTPPLSSP
jgi:hypothetical protein